MAWGLARISSRELAEWMAFDRIEPVGARRSDGLFAGLMSLIANAFRNPEKRRRPFVPRDFYPDFWEAAADELSEPPEAEGRVIVQRQSSQDMLATMMMIAQAMDARDSRAQ